MFSSKIMRLVFVSTLCLGACDALETHTKLPSLNTSQASSKLTLTDKTRVLEEGSKLTYQTGMINVLLDRNDLNSGSTNVQVHKFTAKSKTNAPPVYFLRGAPFEGLEPYLDQQGYFSYYIEPYTEFADVVVVGQRGFGASGEFPCPPMSSVKLAEVDALSERISRHKAGIIACRDLHEQNGIDLTDYSVRSFAHDVADVATALGHSNIQLRGQSFGSHWAMAIMRYHGDIVERATLSGIEGPDHTFDLPLEKRASIQRIAQEAIIARSIENDATPRDFLAAFEALVEETDLQPFEIKTHDIETKAPINMILRGDDLRRLSQGIRGTNWRYIMPTWEQDIKAMLSGDFDQAGQRLQRIWLNPNMQDATFYSIECSSGLSPKRRTKLDRQRQNPLILPGTLHLMQVCEDWPTHQDEDYRSDLTSDIPTVLMHGTYDTAVPFGNALEVASHLENSHLIEIQGGSHGAYIEADETIDGFREGILEWMQTGSTEHLSETVKLPPLEWKEIN